MESSDDTTENSADDDISQATSGKKSEEDDDDMGGFVFDQELESGDEDDNDTSGFVFDQELETGNEEEQSVNLAEQEEERVVDLVRLQPSKNAELQDQWGLDSGSEVHQYLESDLRDYYYRDDDGYIRATDAAEEFAQEHQNVYQDVTQPNNEPDEAPDLQRRDLALALVTLTQELGHLPSPKEVNAHGEYRHQQYREEFGDLFNAFKTAGILPDDVKRTDFFEEDEPESETEPEAKSKPVSEPEQGGETEEADEAEEELDSEPVQLDVAEIDVNRPNFQVPEDTDESDLVEEIQWFADTLEEPPTEELVAAYGRFPADAYRETFGSWWDALSSAGCDPEDLPDMSNRGFTNVEVLDIIRAVADELGRPPTTIETGERAPFSHGLGSVRFGSWATALEIAGLDPSERPGVDSSGDGEREEESIEQSGDGVEFTVSATFCDDCGSAMVPNGDYWLCESCGRQQPKKGQTQREQPELSNGSSHQEQSGPSVDPAQQEAGTGQMVGPVVFFHDRKGYGFIEHDSVEDDVFFHIEDLGGAAVHEGQELQFELTFTDEGPRAKNPQRVEKSSTDTIDEESSGDSIESTQAGPSRQELLDEIRRLDGSLDRIPYTSDMDQHGQFSAYAYRDQFGSWDEALEAAGIDKEAVLLEDMRQVADTVHGDITQPAMNEHGEYSAGMAARFFGSWSEAKERLEEWEASKPGEDADETESVKMDAASGDADRPSFDVPADIDKSDLVDEIQRFADIIDEPPTEELVVAYGRYPGNEYRKEFGSWDAALETAGLDPDDIPDWDARSHTNVEVLDGLRAVADELGRAPTTTEAENHVEFSPGLASLRFGSWGDALETAGLDPSERSSVRDSGSADSTDTADVDTGETMESDDDGGEDDDPIGSVIDDTLENMLLSDDDDDSPV